MLTSADIPLCNGGGGKSSCFGIGILNFVAEALNNCKKNYHFYLKIEIKVFQSKFIINFLR